MCMCDSKENNHWLSICKTHILNEDAEIKLHAYIHDNYIMCLNRDVPVIKYFHKQQHAATV